GPNANLAISTTGAGAAAAAKIAGMTKAVNTTSARMAPARTGWAVTREKAWLIALSSGSERRVDQSELMPSADNADLARAEQLAELAGRHGDRTGLADARLARRGQRIGQRHRGVQRNIAFDLLQHLMDVAVEHGDRSERTQQRYRLRRIGGAPAPGFPNRPQRNMPQHHDRGGVRDVREIVFYPGELFVAERRKGAHLEVEHVVQGYEMRAALIEAVPGLAVAIVIEELEIAGYAVIDGVVLARNRVHAVDMDFLQQFARLAEFLGFRQVAHIAGVHDEGRCLRQRVDVGDGVAQAAYKS